MKIPSKFSMKRKFFTCFHPLVLETEANQIKDDSTIPPSIIIHKKDQISVQRSNSKRPFSKVVEILLHKASLKIKVSDRNCRQLLLQPKNATLRRISKHLQKSRRDKGLEEAKVSRAEIGRRSSYEQPAAVGPRLSHEESREGSSELPLVAKPFSSGINPGLYLILAVLFFTVVLGRVSAVLFALLFIFLFSGILR